MGPCLSATSNIENPVVVDFKGYGSDWMGPPKVNEGRFKEFYTLKGSKGAMKRLGEGAYGQVYLGYRLVDKKKCAVKVTSREGHNWKRNEEDLMREVKVLQKCKHPNVVDIYDFFVDDLDKKCYVVFEYLKGGDLFDAVVKRKETRGIPYNELEARGIIYIILKTLEFIHSYDIVHRDIKPENLLLETDTNVPTIRIADFGFADKESMIEPGHCGTPGYMAPEIIQLQKYGKPSDIFSLGVVMFILFAGYPPTWQAGPKPADINQAIVAGAWDFSGTNNWKIVSMEVKDLIQKCMSLNPVDRPTVSQALAHAWMAKAPAEFDSRPLDDTMKALKKFNAKRKLMKYVRGVIAANRFKKLLGGIKASASASAEAENTNDINSGKPSNSI
jgi:serine/threonine protein kinase